MARYLHTMYRITDPERSRAFYEALGFEFRRDLDIVREGVKRKAYWRHGEWVDGVLYALIREDLEDA